MTNNTIEQVFSRAIQKKKKDFPHFSLRWMAKKMEISHVYLSYIVTGRRPLPVDKIEAICDILDIDEESKTLIYQHAFRASGYRPLDNQRVIRVQGWNLVNLDNFDLISRWEPIAILLTIRLKDYDGSNEFISKRLGLPLFFVQSILDLLLARGFVTESGGKFFGSEKYYEFQSQSSKEKIRKYHRSVINRATHLMQKKVDQASVSRRHITSAAFTCSKEVSQHLKLKVNDFIKDCSQLAAQSEAEEVFQLAIQLFPVTEE